MRNRKLSASLGVDMEEVEAEQDPKIIPPRSPALLGQSTPKLHSMTTTHIHSNITTESSSAPSTPLYGKTKVKTRPGTPVIALSDKEIAGIDEDLNGADMAADGRIAVCTASMDIFARMFVSYGKHSNSNLRWGEFVKAMADAGFDATQSTGGSAVVFECRGAGAIRLHQPHPDPTINPIMLRSFGKRMFKQFGWNIETFVERE